MFSINSTSVNYTKELGKRFGNILKKGDVIVLSGDLGAGKTMFVSGFLSFYEKENESASPTFTIVNEHSLKDDLKLFHFDVYRLDFEDEFTAIGGEEFFYQGICIIEWGEKIKDLLPKNFLEIKIQKNNEDINSRTFTFIPHGNRYEKIVEEVFKNEDTCS